MNIGSILKKVGGSLLRNALPPLSGMAFDLINNALPDNKKLSETSTGADAAAAVKTLPPDQRASLMEKKLDVEIEEIKAHVNVITALAEVDNNGKSTRPNIALEQSKLIGFGVVIILGPIGYAIVTKDHEMIKTVADIWPLILAVIGIPAGIVNSYFGKRFKEKAQKYEAVASVPPAAGMISQIVGMFKK